MIPSPCTNICQMETSTGLCRGCFRTIDEITAWSRSDDASRQQILVAIAKRRQPDFHHPRNGDHDD